METRIFSNNEAAKITGTTPRQVLSWTERGMIIPYIETSGTGTKRGYNYTNLLEIILCKILIKRHFNFQKIKDIFLWLRTSGNLEDWATNFKKWHIEAVKKNIEHFKGLLNEAKKKNGPDVKMLESVLDMVGKMNPAPPEKPTGTFVIYFFDDLEQYSLLPYNIDDTIALNTVKQAMMNSLMIDIINLGRIKSLLDKKLI